jgi:hypothetical protein
MTTELGHYPEVKVSLSKFQNSIKLRKQVNMDAKSTLLELAITIDEHGLCEPDSIAAKVKHLLSDEIKSGVISERWIEMHLPSNYRRRYTKKMHLANQAPQSPPDEGMGARATT